MALKSTQRSRQSVDLLKEHASAVEKSFLVALDHAELFPAEEGERIREELTTEIQVFRKAVKRFQTRTPIKEIRQALAPDQDVRSWLIYRSMPSTIARYSHSQVKAEDIARREEITARRLLDFHQRHEAAVETVRELPMSEAQRREILAKLRAEKQTMTKGFALYRKGFSFVDIDRITGIGIQNRALEGAIPETTRHYGGDVLSQSALNHRHVTAQKIRAYAQNILAEAERKNEHEPEDRKAARFERIAGELKNLDFVLSLYERGLSPNQIKRLTKLPADSWILQGSLPPTLLRSSERLIRRDFRIPRTLDHEASYIIGAYLARARSLNQRALSFSAPTAALAQELISKIEKAFHLQLEPPRKVGDMYVVEIARRDFVLGFKRLSGLDTGSVVTCLDSVIFYPYFRRPFLEGFLSFAGGNLTMERSRYSLTRTHQRELLAGVAIALSFEGIYPTLHNTSDNGGMLQVCDAREFRALIREFPQVGANRESQEARVAQPTGESVLDGLSGYLKITELLARHFPPGKRLNFKKLKDEGGVDLDAVSFTPEERSRVKGWRLGHMPLVAQRAKNLAKIAHQLFPDRYGVM